MPFSHWLHFCVWAWGSKGTDRHVMAPTMDPGSWFDIAREETANSAMDFILDHLQWPVDRGHGAGCRRCHILLHLAAADTCRLSSYLQNTRYYIYIYYYIIYIYTLYIVYIYTYIYISRCSIVCYSCIETPKENGQDSVMIFGRSIGTGPAMAIAATPGLAGGICMIYI